MFKPDHASVTYENLELNEIRIVRFTTIDDSSFSLALETVNLSDSPEYYALSYAWGPKADSTIVRVGGDAANVLITPNLLSAITHIRNFATDCAIWIDALCINQEDMAERTEQVSLMSSIYNKASKVLIWLGDEDFTSPLAFELLAYSTEIARISYQWDIQPYIDAFRQKLDDLKEHIDAVRLLLSRPYWGRLWIVQEVILSTDAVIMCGKNVMAWDDFQNAFHFLERCGIGPLLKSAMWNDLNNSRAKYKNGEEKEYFGLTRMLYRNRPRKATDPRDKIFGLLGIANEGSDPAFRADYERTARNVYTDAARKLLLGDPHLELLGAVQPSKKELAALGTTLETTSDIDLPSWVPDWSVGWIAWPLSPPNSNGSPSYFAAGSSKPSVKFVADEPEKISLRGLCVDQIKEIHSGDRKFDHVPLATYISDMVHILGLPEWYSHTDEIMNTALFHTMNADLSPLSNRIDNGHRLLIFPEYDTWAATNPASIDSMPAMVEVEQKRNIDVVCKARDFLLTEHQFLGLGSMTMKVGDLIVVLLGGNLPFVLRKNGDGDEYRFVGECYVHGIMDGEALSGKEDKDFQDFVLG